MPISSTEVAVTGLGVVTAAGYVEQLWQAALQGKTGARFIEHFETEDLPSRIAVYIPGAEDRVDEILSPKFRRRMERYVQLGLVAAVEAWQDAGFSGDSDLPDPERIAIFVGTGGGGGAYAEESVHAFDVGGVGALGPYTVSRFCSNSLAGAVSIRLNIQGPSATFCTACASSTYAIRAARDEILLGRADMAIVVGSEATVMRGTLAAFGAAGVLSRRNDAPDQAHRPFDAERDGFVLGEGAGAIVLERADRAQARGANLYARLAGIGVASDAHHPLACLPDGAGAARAIQRCLDDAELSPEHIGHVNAHGSGTKLNDSAESKAFLTVLGEHAQTVPISSTKPISGHLIGASGAIEAVLAIKALQNHLAPPTANWQFRDKDCPLNYVPNQPQPFSADAVLSNSVGFGGVNACIAFTAF